ncbi:MAG: translation initiation factor IF-2 [Bdellovibrionales bacterium]|nr:translation initiation factor IF-2 [Bdellovibrionales bacterium]
MAQKVYEFAKEVGLETIALMDKIKGWGLPVKSHMSSLDGDLIEKIKSKLDEEEVAESSKKKVVKKKKKVAGKTSKVAAKAKTAKKKAAVKKAVTKKTVAKKTTAKKASGEGSTEEAKTKKVVRKKTGVIRRKAADIEAKEKEELILKQAAEQAALAEEVLEETPVEVSAEGIGAGQGEVAIEEASTDASQDTTTEKTRAKKMGRNILGKIDLSKTQKAGGTNSTGAAAGNRAASATTAPRTMKSTNIRTGFVAPALPVESAEKKEEDRKKKAGAGKDLPVKSFVSSDFRKREVIFQPKRKKVIGSKDQKKTQITVPKASKRIVKMYETIKVSELADQMKLKVPVLMKKLIGEGVMANMNTELDQDTVTLIASEFQFDVQSLHRSLEEQQKDLAFGNLDADLVSRPPIVTVMGHVDHGKTTLLDTIRKANVVTGEAGGITQHIGAYEVKTKDGSSITFIDTPGHAAFTAMRARGANVTDIVIIVVAADDGIMPQTVEAISHAKAAGVPIIVAVNKIDKPQANQEKVRQQLTEHGLVAENWGGDTIFCEVSALKGTGVPELLEQIHLVAEMQELKANPERSGTGVIIESKVAKGKGTVATLLILDGTVSVGQFIVAGKSYGRVRSLIDDKGAMKKSVGPGLPVEVTGFGDPPQAGDRFDLCKSEELARETAETARNAAEKQAAPDPKMSLEDLFAKVKTEDFKELPVILKADVDGSLEAIKGAFTQLKNDEVSVNVIHGAVGAISESDVLLASTSGGVVLGFNVRPDVKAQSIAKEKGVEIKSYRVIYELIDDVKKALGGLLKPDRIEKVLGHAEVRETFSVPKLGMIAGSYVNDGKIIRGGEVRLLRDGRVIYEGKVGSLKRFKDDAKEVASGFECGIGIENFNDIKVSDVIEAYEIEEIAREYTD